jgi:hypothetical protein
LIYLPKVFAFPLNSKYIKQKLIDVHKMSEEKVFFLNGTSEDILFLFENVLFEEIRNFSPNIILINYNGVLHIN